MNKEPYISPSQARALKDQKAKRVLVAGSRDFTDYELMCRKLKKYLAKLKNIYGISGGAKGADTLAKQWFFEHGWSYCVIKPDYDKYDGKVAPIIRNQAMVDKADFAVFFWSGSSPGTKATIAMAKKKGIPYRVVHYG